MSEEKNLKGNAKIEEMFKAGAHFGYPKSRRHVSTSPYIFGVKNKVEIINLEKTAELLEKACAFVASIAKEGKQILFVSGKNEAKDIISINASSINMPNVAGRWIGGALTNYSEIKKRIAKYEDLLSQKEKGELSKYTKKERLLIDRQIEKLERMFAGITNMKEMPKAVFVVDPKKEVIVVKEAQAMGIPVIALASSDCDLSGIDYPIVANDTSVSSIAYFVAEIAKAYQAGKSVK